MQLFLAAAIGLFVAAASLVGVRLLLLARRTGQLPELLVGVGFALIGLLGYPLAMISGFGRGTVAEVNLGMWVAGMMIMNVGLTCLYAFTARVFRSGRVWAWLTVALLSVANLGSASGSWGALVSAPPEALSYQVTAAWSAAGQITSGLGFAWIGLESWLQFAMSRKRRALGLADAVVTNRFLLFVLFATSAMGMNAANSLALAAGVSAVESVPVQASMAVLGLAASACMYLAFLPAPVYRRWIERRGA
jgi:hypothetical protein